MANQHGEQCGKGGPAATQVLTGFNYNSSQLGTSQGQQSEEGVQLAQTGPHSTQIPSHIMAQTSLLNMTTDLEIATHIRKTNKANALEVKIYVHSNWNLKLLQQLCESDLDREVVVYLTYGWPISHDGLTSVSVTLNDHRSVTDNPKHIQLYLQKELQHNTLIGPLATSPFVHRTAVSPMSTRGKKKPGKKTVIVDCSWPEGASINDGIQCGNYMEQNITLWYPTVDDLCKWAKQLGLGCYGYRKDMARAF